MNVLLRRTNKYYIKFQQDCLILICKIGSILDSINYFIKNNQQICILYVGFKYLLGMRKLFFVVFLILIGTSIVPAQMNLNKLKKKAANAYQSHQFTKALDLYLEVYKQDKSNANTNYYVGMCYMHSLHQEKALDFFIEAEKLKFEEKTKPHINNNPPHYKYTSEDLDFNLGRTYHLSHQFQKAITYYKKYEVKIDKKNKKIHDDEMIIIEHLIEEAHNGVKLIQTPVDVELINLGKNINTEYPDYAPLLSADGQTMIFTSRRPGSTGSIEDSTEDVIYREDIYISKYKNGQWTTAQQISTEINTADHDCASGLSPDGKTLFLNKSVGSNADIWYSTESNSHWSKPSKLHHQINTLNFEAGGSITDDSSKFFFISTRSGGQGEKDIYMATKNKQGEWSHPINLGEQINTPFNEESPFISPDGKTLYFSSQGHNSMGGYDIFKSEYNEDTKKWSTPVNLGYPINTANDELFFVTSHDGTKAYLSTHHEDCIGHLDIYMLLLQKN